MNEYVLDGIEISTSLSIGKYIYYGFKRIFDILFSLYGLCLLIIATILVKIGYILCGDFKSVFYTQQRIGKNGKLFKFYKFRTMCKDADQVLEELMKKDPVIREEYNINKKLKNDPRVTKVGKIIRKLSIDEMPQFINILKGDMSLIGNRPYLPRERDDMGEYYNDIVKTKQGLTGYWQVEGRYNTSFNKRLELEQYYSNHVGLRIDVKIFFKTFKVVLKKDGAE